MKRWFLTLLGLGILYSCKPNAETSEVKQGGANTDFNSTFGLAEGQLGKFLFSSTESHVLCEGEGNIFRYTIRAKKHSLGKGIQEEPAPELMLYKKSEQKGLYSKVFGPFQLKFVEGKGFKRWEYSSSNDKGRAPNVIAEFELGFSGNGKTSKLELNIMDESFIIRKDIDYPTEAENNCKYIEMHQKQNKRDVMQERKVILNLDEQDQRFAKFPLISDINVDFGKIDSENIDNLGPQGPTPGFICRVYYPAILGEGKTFPDHGVSRTNGGGEAEFYAKRPEGWDWNKDFQALKDKCNAHQESQTGTIREDGGRVGGNWFLDIVDELPAGWLDHRFPI